MPWRTISRCVLVVSLLLAGPAKWGRCTEPPEFDKKTVLRGLREYRSKLMAMAVRIVGTASGEKTEPVLVDGKVHSKRRFAEDDFEAFLELNPDAASRRFVIARQSDSSQGPVRSEVSWDGTTVWELHSVGGRPRQAIKSCESPSYQGVDDAELMPWILGFLSSHAHQASGFRADVPWLDQMIEKSTAAEWDNGRWLLHYTFGAAHSAVGGVRYVVELATEPHPHLVAYERQVERGSGKITVQRFDATYDNREGFWVPVAAEYVVGERTAGKATAIKHWVYRQVHFVPNPSDDAFRLKIDDSVPLTDLCTPEARHKLEMRRRVTERRRQQGHPSAVPATPLDGASRLWILLSLVAVGIAIIVTWRWVRSR